MKRVSFEVAKYIKEVGYPQANYGSSYSVNGQALYGAITENEYYAPTYLNVWLWLWREKSIQVDIESKIDFTVESLIFDKNDCLTEVVGKDPEEAIIAAINYLVKNTLIK